jgi:hypothetical protein
MTIVLNVLFSIVFATVVVAGLIVTLGWLVSTPPYRGPVTDHFDGKRFRNQRATSHNDFRDAMKWATNRERGVWRRYRDEPTGPTPPQRVDGDRLRVTFVNHTTVLLQTHGVTSSPIWSELDPIPWFGPRVPPGIRLQTFLNRRGASQPKYDPAICRPSAARPRASLNWWRHSGTVASSGRGIPVFRSGLVGFHERVGRCRPRSPARHFSGRHSIAIARCGPAVATVVSASMADTGLVSISPSSRAWGQLALLPIGAFRR